MVRVVYDALANGPAHRSVPGRGEWSEFTTGSMISVDTAIECILRRSTLPAAEAREELALHAAVGRVLASDVRSDVDLPPFSRSTVDGFALRCEEARPNARLEVIAESAAGRPTDAAVVPGTAVRTFTGAEMPRGADAVVMVEQTVTQREGTREFVELAATLPPLRKGQNFSPGGEDIARGAVALSAGTPITIGALGLLASIGATRLPVIARPRVAILTTGTELVPPDRKPLRGQIRESNGTVLAALVRQAGGEVIDLGIVEDDEARIRAAVERGLESDLLLISGGSSVGDYDFTPAVLAALGVTVHFDRVQLKPGKPTLFGTRGRHGVFGLPGNPISAFVTFHLFVRPWLRVRAGLEAAPPPRLRARLRTPVKRAGDRDQALPARLAVSDGALEVSFVGWHGSGDVTCLSAADALLFVPSGSGALEVGASCEVTPLATGRAGDLDFLPRG